VLKVFAISLAAASVMTALAAGSSSDAHAAVGGNPSSSSSSSSAADADVHATALNLTVGEYVELDFLPTGYGFEGASYRLTDGVILPAGLKLNSSTGIISGKPEVAETVQLSTFEVVDSAGQVANSVVEVFWINPELTTATPR
jgi:hypothetical protein